MRELALFAGAGGGILGGHLLGWRTVCAVEWDAYAAGVLLARQNDGALPPFPVWDDVQTFDGYSWRGVVDVVSGGFPCQDISVAGKGGGSTDRAAACGGTWRASSVRFDRATSSWKTHRLLFDEDLPESSVILPRWGMTRDGACWERTKSALRTSAIGSGSSPTYPTPCTIDSGSRFNLSSSPGASLRPTLGAMARFNLWPTPTVQMAQTSSLRQASADKELHRSMLKNRFPMCLSTAIQGKSPLWTPPAKMCPTPLNAEVGGPLNPMWVEWLMGWPLGWTDLGPLAMDRFQQWCASHGGR